MGDVSQVNTDDRLYGFCTGCGMLHAVKKDGTLFKHYGNRDVADRNGVCKGAGQPPRGGIAGPR